MFCVDGTPSMGVSSTRKGCNESGNHARQLRKGISLQYSQDMSRELGRYEDEKSRIERECGMKQMACELHNALEQHICKMIVLTRNRDLERQALNVGSFF
jgi:hypothetical protein